VVALLAAGEHEQVAALRVRRAVLRPAEPEREFRAEDRPDAGVALRGLRHAHDAVEAVVVGDREGVQTEARGLFEQLLR
jgi:hypothetical protein